MSVRNLILNKDYATLAQLLTDQPLLANEGVALDQDGSNKVHPLHRICDAVFFSQISDQEGVQLASIFLEHGADINGHSIEMQDTPLTAACSLHADKVALYYIACGANIHHRGCHGGTALHWAAWCGRAQVVHKLIEVGANINQLCIDFQAIPLFWAVRAIKNNVHSNVDCVHALLKAGAIASIPNREGKTVMDLMEASDKELKEVLDAYL